MLKFDKNKYIIEIPSDFKIKVEFLDGDINSPFKIAFWDERGNSYLTYNTGIEKKNCVIDRGNLYIIFENYPFKNCTRLRYTQYTSVEDADFADDRLDAQQSYTTPICLVTTDATDKIKDNSEINAVLSLDVAQGAPGKSAYEIAVENGFVGNEEEWLGSLKGEKGEKGEQGLQGVKGDKGEQGLQGEKGEKGDNGKIQEVAVNGVKVNDVDGKVNIEIPTKLSELENDSDFATKDELKSKVDKIAGKELSSNDFTDADKTKLDGLENYDDTKIKADLEKKVDKEIGKGLSTNDFTTAEKNKLAGLKNTIVDSELSTTSENPVQNKVIAATLGDIETILDNINGD